MRFASSPIYFGENKGGTGKFPEMTLAILQQRISGLASEASATALSPCPNSGYGCDNRPWEVTL
ncbi:MAG: hypothetical protein U0894_03835 [Pirellulales bacterium]